MSEVWTSYQPATRKTSTRRRTAGQLRRGAGGSVAATVPGRIFSHAAQGLKASAHVRANSGTAGRRSERGAIISVSQKRKRFQWAGMVVSLFRRRKPAALPDLRHRQGGF